MSVIRATHAKYRLNPRYEKEEPGTNAHFKWAGHDGINDATGLTYMQVRWMDNNTGRFISIDPIQDGYNWYAYCEGNPVTYTDPTGLFPAGYETTTPATTPATPVQTPVQTPVTPATPVQTPTTPLPTGPGLFDRARDGVNNFIDRLKGSIGPFKSGKSGDDGPESPHIGRSGPFFSGPTAKERIERYSKSEVRRQEKAKYNNTESTENIGNKLVLSYSADITRGTVYSEEAREHLLYSVEQTRRALEDGNVIDEIPDAEELSKFKATLEYYEGRLVKANISYDIKAESRPKVGITGGFIYYEEKESGDSILPNNDVQRSYSYGHPKNYYFGLASGAAQPTYDETLIVDGFTLSRGLFKNRVAIKEGVKSAKNGLPKLFRNSKYALGALLGLGDDAVKSSKYIYKSRSMLKESPALVKAANEAGKNPVIQREMDNLIHQFLSGNANPGLENKNLFKNINYLRGKNGARVFFRMKDGVFEVLGKANKHNESKVINVLKKLYD